MRASVLLLLLPLVRAESDLSNTNGWVPVSNEVVFDQIKREGTRTPQNTPSVLIHTDRNKILPQKEFDILKRIVVETDKEDCNSADIICILRKTKEPVKISQDLISRTIHELESKIETRRSKKIPNIDFRYSVQDLFFPETSSPKTKTTYEVTEKNLDIEETIANKKGYVYESPKITNKTNTLFEILSKYKINKDDNLPNYVISLKHKAPIPSNKLSSVTSIPHLAKYNNLNHLPVDPMMAVFLSNYGFYLQGMYGIKNRYNNLFGYLASNNIHNNRPFGLYKIYSDTDSSH